MKHNDDQNNKSSLSKVEFLLPLHDNDGKPFENNVLSKITNTILELAGGFSRESNLIQGFYKDSSGKILKDINRKYTVAVKKVKIQEVMDFLNHDVKRLLSQESIYIEIKNNSEIRLI